MILGRIAVGIIIFAVIFYLLFNLPEWANESEDWRLPFVAVIVLGISLYCAISGTYLLYLGGKI